MLRTYWNRHVVDYQWIIHSALSTVYTSYLSERAWGPLWYWELCLQIKFNVLSNLYHMMNGTWALSRFIIGASGIPGNLPKCPSLHPYRGKINVGNPVSSHMWKQWVYDKLNREREWSKPVYNIVRRSIEFWGVWYCFYTINLSLQ